MLGRATDGSLDTSHWGIGNLLGLSKSRKKGEEVSQPNNDVKNIAEPLFPSQNGQIADDTNISEAVQG